MCPFINLSKEAYTPKDFGTDASDVNGCLEA